MPRLSDILDLNAPAKIGAMFSPSAIDERALGAEQVQATRDQITRGRRLRELTSSGASDLPQRLAQEGFVNEVGQYQALADSAENRAAKKQQGADTARRNKFLELSARGINGDVRDQDIAAALGEMGLPPDQASAYLQDVAERRNAGQNLQEFFYSLGDPEGYAKLTGQREERKFRSEEAASSRNQRMAELQQRAADTRLAQAERLAAQREMAQLRVSLNAQGNKQLSPTAQKAVMETDNAILAGDQVIDVLSQAIAISPKAYEGGTAGIRAKAMGFVPGSFEGENASVELNNLVLGQALSQLKAMFGGAPTEGERKILLELQGSVDLKAPQREAIYRRAMEFAKRRMDFNMRKADALRNGEYFNESFVGDLPKGGRDRAETRPPLPVAAPKPPAKQPASGGAVSLDQYLKSKGF